MSTHTTPTTEAKQLVSLNKEQLELLIEVLDDQRTSLERDLQDLIENGGGIKADHSYRDSGTGYNTVDEVEYTEEAEELDEKIDLIKSILKEIE
jgi:hypothetical protein